MGRVVMKKIILLLLCCVLFGCTVGYYPEDWYVSDGIAYDKGTNLPLDGEVFFYDANGNLEFEGPYKNGKAEGLVKIYYKSGSLLAEVPFKNGKREGLSRIYDENGNLQIEMPFKNDECEGLAKAYYENGNLLAEANFSRGKAVSGYRYDWEGNRTKMTNAHLHNLNKKINSFQ